jgi:hypothetical protein
MKEELQLFLEKLRGCRSAKSASFPPVELYMDQAVTWLNGQCAAGQAGDDSTRQVSDGPLLRGITPNMVNNYVKDGFIKRPALKRYGKEQLADLSVLMLLKDVLPIPVIADSMRGFPDQAAHLAFYDRFAKLQDEAFEQVAKRMEKDLVMTGSDALALRAFALRLASEANALRLVSARMLELLGKGEPEVNVEH